MMKKHLNIAITFTLVLLLIAGQLPLLAAAKERETTRRLEPFKPPRRSKKQEPVQAPRPAGESVTLLGDGRTLHLGGESPSGPTTSAEIRDERNGAVTHLSESFRHARAWHTATVLPDGLVFIFGGVGSKGEVLTRPELFDPETNIKYGMKYLGKAQKLGNGTTCGTILKYNAGHGAKRMNPVSANYCAKVRRHMGA